MAPSKPSRGATKPGRVRIIGGRLRGSILAVPERPGLRPTPARVRETLFNWLQPVLAGARCLDLFAGSGALGFEAASRGAAGVRLVEKDAALAQALRANAQRLGCANVTVLDDDARAVLGRAATVVADVVFVDPPFAEGLWDDILGALDAAPWLAANAWIYVETPTATRPVVPSRWFVHRQLHAGAVCACLYRRQAGIG